MNRFLPILAWLARICFYVGGLFLCVIWLCSALSCFHSGGNWSFFWSIWKVWTAIDLMLVVMAITFFKKWLQNSRNLGIGYACLLLVYVWMGWDDLKVNRPLTLADLGPAAVAHAEESYQITLWYSEIHGQKPLHQFDESKYYFNFALINSKEWGATSKDFTKDCDRVRAAWDETESESDWISAMDKFEVIGDLSEGHIDDPLLNFRPFRAVMQVGAAHARLLALEGKGDEAIDELLPLVRVSNKLLPASRTITRWMIAHVGLHTAVEAGRYVLSHSKVSPERRAQLAAAIGGYDPAALLDRFFLIEYARFNEALVSEKRKVGTVVFDYQIGALGRRPDTYIRVLNQLDSLLLLHRATVNEYGVVTEEIAKLARRRDLSGLDKYCETLSPPRLRIARLKNVGGGWLLDVTFLPYQRLVRSCWNDDDERLELLAELRAKGE
jgi:hypothetical protein